MTKIDTRYHPPLAHLQGHAHEVCVDAAQHSEVADDDDTAALPLELDNDRAHALNNIQIALAPHLHIIAYI